jgi:hypothetical protein
MYKTRKNKVNGSVTRGWKKQQPGYHEKTLMIKKCGKKCFLGPNKSFPICRKKTCKVSAQGVYSAYIRAKQHHHKNISQKAKKILVSMGIKR